MVQTGLGSGGRLAGSQLEQGEFVVLLATAPRFKSSWATFNPKVRV